jgi:large subunit ribosomal protein L17
LIKHRRVTTTLAKAKAARPVAEKLLTLGKSGTIHHRRLAAARLHQEDAVRILFNEIAPSQKGRHGGYTRIVKLHERRGDAAQLAILEWVDESAVNEESADEAPVKEKAAPRAKKEPSAATPSGKSAADESDEKAPLQSESKLDTSEDDTPPKKDDEAKTD